MPAPTISIESANRTPLLRGTTMKLTLIGHDDLYAVEQLQISLFGNDAPGEAVSRLSRSGTYITASAKITYNGQTARASRRFKAADETVRLRRQKLQQSYYAAAVQLLSKLPSWGALSGVRPTKLSTQQWTQQAV